MNGPGLFLIKNLMFKFEATGKACRSKIHFFIPSSHFLLSQTFCPGNCEILFFGLSGNFQ